LRLNQLLKSFRRAKRSKALSRSRLGLIEWLEDRRLMAILENFDGVIAPALPSGWVQTSPQSNAWGTVTGSSSDTAPNHAFVSNPMSVSESILTSPSFVLPASTPLLQFRNSFSTEASFDGGVLEIAINGGGFADILVAGGSFLEGGYFGTLATGAQNPIEGRAAWTGNSLGYITTTANLPASAINQNVQLRWRFGSDNSVGVIGWRIDTITLTAITDDFGDSPAPYPVTVAQNGARHTVGALRLGASVDLEIDGVRSANADSDGSDEDGVTITGNFVSGSQKLITVNASQSGGVLNAWIDWNADGDWVDANEQVFVDRALDAGSNALVINVPAGLNAATTFARFRLSSATGLSFNGQAADGEVEDYLVSITSPGNGKWTPLGPFGATNGQIEGIANRPVTGALHTVLAHPTNADIVYVGSVNGGVWKTTNATSLQPVWSPLTDSMPSLSIGALAFDLADATANTLYAGIGRYSGFGQIGSTRTGVMRTTDGGQTWQAVDGGGILLGKNISGIYANGNTIVVSVNVADNFAFGNIGIFRSTDGGTSFTQISSGTGSATGLPSGTTHDLVYDPITPTTLYTATVFSNLVGGANGIYKSTNSGANWSLVSPAAFNSLVTNNTTNIKLATGRNNEVYAAVINSNSFAGLFRSPNNGTTWVQMDSPRTNENGTDIGLLAGGTTNGVLSIVADPTNANIVYLGGDRQPRSHGDTGSFPNAIGAQDFSGRLFRGDASQPAGSQFVHLTHRDNVAALPGGGTASNTSPHADSRDLTFDAAGNLLQVDSGGIYRRTSPQTNTGDWFSMIGNLQTAEVHSVAWDSLSNVAITGNQDIGTTYQPTSGATNWISLSTGHGGNVAIDQISRAANNQSVRYSSFQNLGSFRQTIWSSTGELVSTAFPSLTPVGDAPGIVGSFRTPIKTNEVAGGRLILLGSNGLYESFDSGSTLNRIGTVGTSDLSTNALSYGGMQNNVANPDVIWAAIGSDIYLRTAGTGNVSLVANDPTTSTIRDLAVNSSDWSNAWAIDNNQVFQTTNAGNGWTDVTGNGLPAGTEFRSIEFVSGPTSSAVILGTNRGVFIMATFEVGVWTALGSGLPNAPAFDLDYDFSDDVLVVGTLGRGAWVLKDVSTLLDVNDAPVVSLANVTSTLPENTSTASSLKVADIVVTDDALGTETLSLTGTDAASFEIVGGNALHVKAGIVLNFEVQPSYTVTVNVDDTTLGSGIDSSVVYILTLTDVNEAPVVSLTNATSTLPENTSTASSLKVADIVVTDDALGTETLSLTGTDAASFEIVGGNALHVKAGIVLNFEVQQSYTVTVNVDDTTLGSGIDSSVVYTLTLTDVNEAPVVSLANATPTLPENTSTASSLKVADIVVTDDAMGTETLSLAGADAASFVIVVGGGGPELHIKSGVVLDLETKASYTVLVNVDDLTVGSGIDSSVVYNLTLTGVNEFPPVWTPVPDLTLNSGAVNGDVTLLANDLDVGAVLSFSAAAQNIEYYLDQTLGLRFSGGNEYLNYLGRNEKWLYSASGAWFYITPNGNFYRWLGGSGGDDPLIEQLSTADYSNTALLYNPAASNAPVVLTVVGNVLTINPSDNFVGKFVVTVTVKDGLFSVNQTFLATVVASTGDAAYPTVTNRTPADAAMITTSSTNIDVTFSKSVIGVDSTDLILTGAGAASAVKGAPTNIGGNTWRFPVTGLVNGTVNVSLAPDANDIEDTSGNELAPVSWSFTVSTPSGNQPPELAAIGDQTISSGTVNGVITLSANDPNGNSLVYGATAQSIEHYLAQTLGLGSSGGNEYLNYLGLNEKWLTSTSGTWYYITPDGKFYRWLGGSGGDDPLQEQLSTVDYANTALLYNAATNNAPAVLTVVGDMLNINPTDTYTGRFVVTATVSDGNGGSDAETFFVTVLSGFGNLNLPAVTNKTPDAAATVTTSSTNIDITFSEPVIGVESTDLILTGAGATSAVKGVPTSIGINTWRFPVTGLVNGTVNVLLAPDANDIEDASGNDLASVSWSFTVSIPEVNQPPVLTPIGDQTMPTSQNTLDVSLLASDPNMGDVLTFSVSGQSQAYVLDQSLGLGLSDGNDYLDWGGLNEKWFTTTVGGWYYIKPNGQFYRWLGGALSSDTLVATLDPSYWTDTSLLYNAQANNPPATFSISGSTLTIDPNDGFMGVFYVTVVVNDGNGGIDTKSFKVTVS